MRGSHRETQCAKRLQYNLGVKQQTCSARIVDGIVRLAHNVRIWSVRAPAGANASGASWSIILPVVRNLHKAQQANERGSIREEPRKKDKFLNHQYTEDRILSIAAEHAKRNSA